MNYDLSLVAYVLEARDLSLALKAGVRPKMLSEEAQVYWDIILDHYNQFHEVPTVDFFEGICPSYTHVPPVDSVDAVLHEVKTRYLHTELNEQLKRIAEANAADPWAAKAAMLQAAETLNLEMKRTHHDLIAGEDAEQVMRHLEVLQRSGGLLGIPWPWDYLNENTLGLVPGNFIYLYGREKSRKTFLLLMMALFWESLGHRVLIISREMSKEEIAWRLYPMRAGLPYPDMTKGNLSTEGMYTLKQAMDDLYIHKNIIVTEDGGGIAGLRAKIEETEPTIVIIDYMKAIADDEMGDKMNVKDDKYVARVADKVKEIAKNPNRKIPIIACGHANREGEKLKGKSTIEMAHSDHISRRADIVMRVVTNEATDQMALIINAGRNVRKYLSWTLDATLDHRFGQFLSPDASWVDDSEDVDKASRKNKEEREEKSLADVKAAIGSFKPQRRR